MTFLCLSRIAFPPFEYLVVSHGVHLHLDGIILFAFFVFRAKLHGLHVVSGDEVSKHVSLGSPHLSDLITEICPSQGVNASRLLVDALDG